MVNGKPYIPYIRILWVRVLWVDQVAAFRGFGGLVPGHPQLDRLILDGFLPWNRTSQPAKYVFFA